MSWPIRPHCWRLGKLGVASLPNCRAQQSPRTPKFRGWGELSAKPGAKPLGLQGSVRVNEQGQALLQISAAVFRQRPSLFPVLVTQDPSSLCDGETAIALYVNTAKFRSIIKAHRKARRNLALQTSNFKKRRSRTASSHSFPADESNDHSLPSFLSHRIITLSHQAASIPPLTDILQGIESVKEIGIIYWRKISSFP